MPIAKNKNTKKTSNSNHKVASNIVNQREAAAHCKVSVNTLRYNISRYPDMPVLKKVDGYRGWKFDLTALDEWRDKTGVMKETTKGKDSPAQSANTQRAQYQADLLKIQLDEKREKLVTKEFVVRDVNTIHAVWAKKLDLIPMQVGRKLGLTPEVIRAIQEKMNEARDTAVAQMVKAGLTK